MVRPRPPTPVRVRRPPALHASTALLLLILALAVVNIESPFGIYFAQALSIFALVGLVGLLFFPAKRWTYGATAVALGVTAVDALTLLGVHVYDAFWGGNQLPWLLGIAEHAVIFVVSTLIFLYYTFGRRTRRYYGYINSPRIEMPRGGVGENS